MRMCTEHPEGTPLAGGCKGCIEDRDNYETLAMVLSDLEIIFELTDKTMMRVEKLMRGPKLGE